MPQLSSTINYAIMVILGLFGVILTAGIVLNLPFENIVKTLYTLSAFFLPVTILLLFFLYKKSKEDTI